MQKTRPRRTGKKTASETGAAAPVGTGRPKHVRTRLILAVAVVAAAIAGAGAPALLTASGQLSDSQDLVTLAGRTQDALALASSLADERDDVTSYIAAGRPKSKAPSEDRSARVDRQVEDLRADTDAPGWLRTDLDGIAAVRRSALTGKSTALETHQAYSQTITELHRLAEELAEQTPPRVGSGAYALAELDSAVQQSAAARGLLLAALNIPSTTRTTISPLTGLPVTSTTTSAADRKQRDALTTAAQQARLRADAALADFHDTAPKAAVDSYDSTVTGNDVNDADKYLAALTDQPTLSDDDLGTGTKKLDAALSARVELMRGVESALYDHRTKDLAQLRDDDVTALEIRVAVLGALMLVAVGIATAMARTLTRPLSVLRRGSARLAEAEDPRTAEPITFTGRNDEFAQVVRSVNTLHAHAVELYDRIATLETDRKHLVGQRQKMADAREELRAEVTDAGAQLERLRTSIGGTFVNLALRTLGLVERQLAVIETLEEREQDPDRLSTLFKLDHFATVMRRHSENLLVLAGTEHVQQHAGPIPLVDVVRAAVSEIERYERVRIASLPPHAHVAGFAADDLSHLLAELMENATASSPPDVPVEISGWLLESGEVMLSVQDEGIGMTADRMVRLNGRLAEFDPESPYDQEGEGGLGLGLYVVARLAHRHGVRVQLREQKQGGVAAVVVLPKPLLAAAPAGSVPRPASAPGTAQAYSLPGAAAEVNSNVLSGRSTSGDPLVTLAEKAVREAGEQPAHEQAPTPRTQDPEPTARPKAPAETFAETTMELLVPLTDPEPEPAEQPEPRTRSASADARPRSASAEDRTQAGAADDRTRAVPAEERAHPADAEIRPRRQRAEDDDWPQPQGAEDEDRPRPQGVDAEDRSRRSRAGDDDWPQPQGADAEDWSRRSRAGDDDWPQPQGVEGEDRTRRRRAGEDDWPRSESAVAESHARSRPAVADGEPVLPGPAAPGLDTRAGDAAGNGFGAAEEHSRPLPATADAEGDDDGEDEVTSKGLPKRTPKITAQAQPPRQRGTGVDADALRRRLGGFRRGADAGRRDVEAEIAEQTGQNKVPSTARAVPGTAVSEEATGGTVEEASS
ncbi:sensor histidine kinase [Streptomyces fuscichromogenes]|uniref:histidine kinase n=1 Tax=Streptomyces fuscichromogenes TaxID=1324013 RepID=A0A917XNS1_9ACTN|nr:nitrate- and nitrite sensing domain-containing protein [Streptomyces fuscichromogenes]GGN41400.1 histidine kinase [Streptomyces fuscichromogenes]